MNRLVEAGEKAGGALTEDMLKDVESYNFRCEQIQNSMKMALNTIHSDIEQGRVLAQSTVNEIKKLMPSLEAFLEDLSRTAKQSGE
jgi:hypothetical protein